MQFQRQSNKQIITTDCTASLGHGGEARIYAVPQDGALVAKVYHKPTDAHAHKLVAMLANPPDNPTPGGRLEAEAQGHISIAWPVDLLRNVDDDRGVVGFLMPRVKEMRPILDFYNPKTRRQHCPLFNYLYLHRTARNLAAAAGALHARGYCIGDVNESNILVSNTALVTLVDTDSFQVHDRLRGVLYRCPVGKPEFTPPELQSKSFHSIDRTPSHDLFGLAVVIFQLLMEGTHPFAGIFQGTDDPPPYEARIKAGHFSYSRGRKVPYKPMPIAPPFEMLHPALQELFLRCFEDGHNNPLQRPSAALWQDALWKAENALVTCSANNQHRYSDHLNACPWCDRTLALGGRDPFPTLQAVQQKQHLQPIPPKRVTPQAKRQSPQTVFTKTPLLLTIPPQKKLSPIAIGLLAVAACGLSCLQIYINNFTSNAKGSATRYNHSDRNTARYEDYQREIEDFSREVRLNPNNPKAYLDRANTRYKLGNYSGDPDREYQQAIADFNEALRLNPNDDKAYLNRGIVRYDMAQYSNDRVREYKIAIADFDSALRINPQQAEAYVKRGIVRFEIAQHYGDFNRGYNLAIEDFNSALSINPQQAEAYLKRGIVSFEIAQYSGNQESDVKEAIEDLKKAANLYHQQRDRYHHQQALGNICVALGDKCDSFLKSQDLY